MRSVIIYLDETVFFYFYQTGDLDSHGLKVKFLVIKGGMINGIYVKLSRSSNVNINQAV